MIMRVAIIDGDTLAYRSAVVSEQRTILVKHLKTGREKEFKNRTEFKQFLENKGFAYTESDYEIIDKQLPAPESHCYHTIKLQVEKIAKSVDAEIVEIYVGGADNFREKLDLPYKYKGNRVNMLRPLLLDNSKDYILKKYVGGLVTGYETDDQLHIRGYELQESGYDPVLCTQDKDANQAVNLKLYNWTDEQSKIVEIPVFGELVFNSDKNKIQGAGLKWLAFQILNGDITDNYTPAHLHKQRFGAKSALKYLAEAKDVNTLFLLVEKKFKEWFPSALSYKTWYGKEVNKDWKEILDMYFSCAYMRREKEDSTDFYSLWQEFRGC